MSRDGTERHLLGIKGEWDKLVRLGNPWGPRANQCHAVSSDDLSIIIISFTLWFWRTSTPKITMTVPVNPNKDRKGLVPGFLEKRHALMNTPPLITQNTVKTCRHKKFGAVAPSSLPALPQRVYFCLNKLFHLYHSPTVSSLSWTLSCEETKNCLHSLLDELGQVFRPPGLPHSIRQQYVIVPLALYFLLLHHFS